MIPIHATATSTPRQLRFVVPPGDLPPRGTVRQAPQTLGVWLDRGVIAALRFKVNLPNYGVFDEKRVFAPGPLPGPVNFRGVRLGLPVCEDLWTDWGRRGNG